MTNLQAKSFRDRVIIEGFISMFPAFISENMIDETNGLKSFQKKNKQAWSVKITKAEK